MSLVRSAVTPVAGGVQIVAHATYPELQVDGKPFFINSAEFLYPRIPRALWERSLDRYREVGINTIALSIPWNWHQPRHGEFDFDGHTNPRRDLRGLLQLITRYGFKLIARPGPAIPREWRNQAFPDWLLERSEYQIPLADRLQGRAALPTGDASAAADVQEWLEAVARELLPYAPSVTVRIPAADFIARRAALLPGAETEVSGPLLLIQIEPAAGTEDAGSALLSIRTPTGGLCAVFARLALSVPCAINSDPVVSSLAKLSPPAFAVSQWYLAPTSGMGDPATLAQIEFAAASLATQPAFPPLLIEYQAGSFAPEDDARPIPSPAENTRLSRSLFVGFGLHGLNWFPLQDALTPAGFSVPWANRYYRWDAAFAVNGSRQARAGEVARFGEWLRDWGSLLAASHLRADFALVDPRSALPLARLSHADFAGVAHTLMQLQRLALYAGMSTQLVDPERQSVEQLLRHPLLLLPVTPEDPRYVLTDQAQRALEAYARAGGVLVCFPAHPAGDVFAKIFKAAPQPALQLPSGSMQWTVGAGRVIVLTKEFHSWVRLSDELTVGAKRFEAPFALSLLDALLTEAGIRATVHRVPSNSAADIVATEIASNEGTMPLGRRTGGQAWLSVVNLSDTAATDETFQVLSPSASAQTANRATGDVITIPVSLPPHESLLLPVDLSLCLERVSQRPCQDSVVSAGAELVHAEREGKSMLLTFYTPAKATVHIHLFDRPGRLDIDDAQANARWETGSHELTIDLVRGASPTFRHVLRLPLRYVPWLPERLSPEAARHLPARVHFYPSGAVRLPLSEDVALPTNPPLFVFRRDSDAVLWAIAENRGGESADVQFRADGQFNTSAHGYVAGGEMRSLNLKLPAITVEKAAAQPPAADGLYHGTLHFSSGSAGAAGYVREDLPVSYALVPAQGSIGYSFDFDADGNAESVLENDALRAIFSPAAGGRVVALAEKAGDANFASTMGFLEDTFAFTLDSPAGPPELRRGGSGTFNRTYSSEWLAADQFPGGQGPALRLAYDAPDVAPHGAHIEKVARLSGERLAVEYHVSLLTHGAQGSASGAGPIFAPSVRIAAVPPSLEILNSIPADREGGTEFCWQPPAGTSQPPASAHCESFVPAGLPITLPAGVTHVQVRRPRRSTLVVDWSDAPEGARVALEPQRANVLLRLSFPPLDAGGAIAAYRIEFTVEAAP